MNDNNVIHDGTNGPQIWGGNLINAPQETITAESGSVSSGGTEDMTDADAAVINNLKTRINDLEMALQKLGLIK